MPDWNPIRRIVARPGRLEPVGLHYQQSLHEAQTGIYHRDVIAYRGSLDDIETSLRLQGFNPQTQPSPHMLHPNGIYAVPFEDFVLMGTTAQLDAFTELDAEQRRALLAPIGLRQSARLEVTWVDPRKVRPSP